MNHFSGAILVAIAIRKIGASVVLSLVLLIGSPSLYAHTDEAEAVHLLSLEIRKDPTNFRLYRDRAHQYRLLGEWEAANHDLDRAERLYPGDPTLEVERGLLRFDQGDNPEAIRFYTRYLEALKPEPELSSARSRTYTLRAKAYEAMDHHEAALGDLAKSIELDPNSSPEIYRQAALLALESCPGSECFHEALAWLDLGISRLGPLISLQKTAIKLDAQLGQWDRALSRIDSSYARADRQDEWLEIRGEILVAAGFDSEAESTFESAFEKLCALPARSRLTPSTQRRKNRLLRLLGPSLENCPLSLRSPMSPSSLKDTTRMRRPYPVLGPNSQEEGLVRGPYLQMGTPTSAIVRWRTEDSFRGSVHYGTDPDSLNHTVIDSSWSVDHELKLIGLSPDTQYFYAVSVDANSTPSGHIDQFFFTPPLPNTSVDTRIWVIGDSGTANDNAAAVRDAFLQEASHNPPDLWLMLGDNAYPHGTDGQYQAAVFAMYPSLLRTSWLWPVLGNHDIRSADSSHQQGVYFDIFNLPKGGEAGGLATGTEAYYSFDWGPVHFIALNSADANLEPDGAMMQWLEADVNATAREWIIAYWHHPPYSKGSHDSDVEDSQGRLRMMRETFLPVLESAGVDLILTGHSHSYERSFLLHRHFGKSHTLDETMVIDGGDGDPQGDGAYSSWPWRAGTVYAVAGSSGKISGGPLNHPAMAVSLNQLGSLILDIQGADLKVQFLNDLGQVEDRFTITHNSP